MGIFLEFEIAPYRIDAEEWENVYEDALRIIDRCDLLDRIVSTRNGLRYAFARKSAEREWKDGRLGVLVCGTMASGFDMEDFLLCRELERYRQDAVQDSGEGDVLFCRWYSEDKEEDVPTPVDTVCIWGSKTQGRPGHIPLLAVMCLFADRFPEAVYIGGDISAGQCRAAVRLANQYLDRPIQEPVICRPEALAERLRKAEISPRRQLEAFFRFFQGPLTPEVGQVLQRTFSPETLYQYFRAELAAEPVGRNHDTLLRYFSLGLSLEDLISIFVTDPEGACLPLEGFLTMLFGTKLHVPFEEKECEDPALMSNAAFGDEEAPRGIEAMLGRAFFGMIAGRNRTLPFYIPLDGIKAACREAFPDGETDAQIDQILAEQAPDETQEKVFGKGEDSVIGRLKKLSERLDEEEEKAEQYDRTELSDLFQYRSGDSLSPKLKEQLTNAVRQIRDFPVAEDYERFLTLDRTERESFFLRRNRYILIREDAWTHIFSHITDDAYLYRYFQLFHVDCSREKTKKLLDPLLNNPELVDCLWELTEGN